jgi:hypothetical protein
MVAAGIEDGYTKLSQVGGGLDWRLYSWEVGGRGWWSRRPMVREEEEEGVGAQEHGMRNRLFFCLSY